ncbi:MAG: 16S rRNA (uracil(1498)-N(3))-methyltransferase [Acidobacteriales bacterium]|nr:16S rRNA (uracil(1498)-N(3))-methyltransferase [Terriglobales bacterium]
MTRRRWHADEISGNHAVITGSHAEHLSRVLRARVGQIFDITDGSRVRSGTISRIESGQVEFELGPEIHSATLQPITVLMSVFKFDRMEWAIEKCTELGVSRIIPIIAERTDSHLAAAANKRVLRWQRIAAQASEQSRRISPPEISRPINLREAIDLPKGSCILLSESESENMLIDALDSQSNENISLAFGPEGGWTKQELAAFHNAGWVSASLGPTILRTETAAISALAVALAVLSRSARCS